MKLKKKAVLYAEGMLDKKDRKSFKKKIETKPEIQKFLNDYMWLEAGLKKYFRHKKESKSKENVKKLDEEIKKDINKYLKNYKTGNPDREKDFISILNTAAGKDEKNSGNIFSLILNIAATIVFIFLIIAAVVHFSENNVKKQTGEQLFTENFQPAKDENILNMQSSYVKAESGKLIFSESPGSFLNNEFNSVLRNAGISMEDLFLVSLALTENGETSLARIYLTEIAENRDPEYYYPAIWYLALLEVKDANYEKAILKLRQLCESNNSYANASCELLKTLDKNNIN